MFNIPHSTAWDTYTTQANTTYQPAIYWHTGYTAAIIWQSFDADISSSILGHMVYIVTILSVEHFLLPTDAHNVKNRRVIKTFWIR